MLSDPGHRGEGLVLVMEQSDVVGGMEQTFAAAVARWPRARVIAASFEGVPDDPGLPAWLRDAERVPLPGRRLHALAPLYARRLARSAPIEADVVMVGHSCGWGLGFRVAPGVPVVSLSAGVPRHLSFAAEAYLPDYPAVMRPLVRAALPALRAHFLRLLRRADRLTAPSQWSSRRLAAATGRQVHCVYPPVTLTPPPASVARRPGRRFLSVARLTRQKRLDVLLEAFRGLDCELDIVGTGPLLEELRRRAPRNVRVLGWLEEADLVDRFARASALVCPSIEDFGIVMAEALTCGVPVIAPAAAGALEVVEAGVTGLLLEDAGAASLRAAVSDFDPGAFDARRCRAAAQRFSAASHVEAVARQLDAVRGLEPSRELSLAAAS